MGGKQITVAPDLETGKVDTICAASLQCSSRPTTFHGICLNNYLLSLFMRS